MVNFGPRDTLPAKFEKRNIYVHNPEVTLMRTTPEECAKLGEIIAKKLNKTTGPTALFVPAQGRQRDRRRGHALLRSGRGRGALRGHPQAPRSLEGRAGRARPRHQRSRPSPTRWSIACRRCSRSKAGQTTAEIPKGAMAMPFIRARRGRSAASCAGCHRQADRRLRRRHRHLGQDGRGRRLRPDHHLQLGPLPDGRPRLAGRAARLRRRQRHRRGDGRRGAARSSRTCRSWPASTAPTRSG